MDPGVLTALITSGGLLVGGTVAVFVKKGSDTESSKATGSNTFLDQLQEQGTLDREAAAKARAEADAARAMLAQAEERFRTQLANMWQQMEAMQTQIDSMRQQHREDMEAANEYISVLTTFITDRREPPAPVRPIREH